MMDNENKVALITGGNSGIGLATAIALAKTGANVVISARRIKEGQEALTQIQQYNKKAVFIATDVSDEHAIQTLIDKTMNHFGRLDFAINNAGITGPLRVPITDYPVENWHEVLQINLTGMWLCMKYQLPIMIKQHTGVIINMSSFAGLRDGKLVSAAYTASKHAIVGLTRHAALENAHYGIRVNTLCPGNIDTTMITNMPIYREQKETLEKNIPVGRLGKVEEVASAVLWLCSPAAAFVTGITLPIDGGMSV